MAYTLIATQTLTTATASVTFSSIPGTFKDLVLEISGTGSASMTVWGRPNNDTSDIYSYTQLLGNGSAASSQRGVSPSAGVAGMVVGYPTTSVTTQTFTMFSYANSSVNKTAMTRNSGAGDFVAATVSLWRSTAVVTSLTMVTSSGTISTGTTFKLWGVS